MFSEIGPLPNDGACGRHLSALQVLVSEAASGLAATHAFADLCEVRLTHVALRAGLETTSGALSFAVYLLGQHPDVQQKIAVEVAALGNRRVGTSHSPSSSA